MILTDKQKDRQTPHFHIWLEWYPYKHRAVVGMCTRCIVTAKERIFSPPPKNLFTAARLSVAQHSQNVSGQKVISQDPISIFLITLTPKHTAIEVLPAFRCLTALISAKQYLMCGGTESFAVVKRFLGMIHFCRVMVSKTGEEMHAPAPPGKTGVPRCCTATEGSPPSDQ